MKAKKIQPALFCLLSVLWCLTAPPSVAAGDADPTPATAEEPAVSAQSPRRTHIFDFEAAHHVDDKVLRPDRWERVATKADSPDYDLAHPFYNEGRVVQDDKESNRFLELVLNRGKVSYQTKAGEKEETTQEDHFIPVMAAKSYRLTARIRTEGFGGPDRPTSAYVSVLWFTKADEASIRRYHDGTPAIFSTPAVTEDTGGQWREVVLTIDTVPPRARFLKLRCTLEGGGIKAKAMFDDITLAEEPHIRLETGRPVPVFAANERIEVALSLNGLLPGRYTERILIVNEVDGGMVHEEVSEFRVEAPGEILRTCYPEVSSFGTFLLRYTLEDEAGGGVAARSIALARIPDNRPLQDSERYGVRFNYFEHPYPVVGNFICASGVGSFKTDLWGNVRGRDELVHFAAALRRKSVAAVGVLGDSPRALTEALGMSLPMHGGALYNQTDEVKKAVLWRFLKEDLAPWSGVLEAVEAAPDAGTPFTGSVEGIVASFAREIDRPLSSAALIFPASERGGSAWPQGARVVSINVPAAMTWRELEIRLSEAPDDSALWVSLELLPQGPEQIDDFLRKTAVCLSAQVDRIFLPLETPAAGLIRVVEFPNESGELTPAFAAFRFVTQMLDNAKSIEDISTGGMRMYLFVNGGESRVVIWSEVGETGLPVYWGEGLKMYDAFGNGTSLPCVAGETTITGLDNSPRIISGIDHNLLQTWRSLQLVEGTVESRVEEQPVEVKMENHFDMDIHGTVQLEFDKELCHLQARAVAAKFHMAPGQRWSSGAAFVLRPSISDVLGLKRVRAVVKITSEEGSFTLRKTLEIEVVPADLSLRIVRLGRWEGGELVIRVAVTNEGKGRASASIYAALQDGTHRRRRVSVPYLKAGEQVEAEFRIHVEPASPPRQIWLGLREIHGWRFANLYISQKDIENVFNK